MRVALEPVDTLGRERERPHLVQVLFCHTSRVIRPAGPGQVEVVLGALVDEADVVLPDVEMSDVMVATGVRKRDYPDAVTKRDVGLEVVFEAVRARVAGCGQQPDDRDERGR